MAAGNEGTTRRDTEQDSATGVPT